MLQKTEISLRKSHVKTSLLPKMNAADKGLYRFAVIDNEDKVLHINCNYGTLLLALSQRFCSNLCGIAYDIEKTRNARLILPNADIVYGLADDIPWRDNTFTVLMCAKPLYEMDDPGKMLLEAKRVLKPGGQMLVTLPWVPTPLNHLMNYNASKSDIIHTPIYYTKAEGVAALESMGFESVTWHANRFGSAVVSGWKPKQSSEIHS